jgi:DNA-binding LacI/PurR family transcriptional regulator
VAEKGRLAAKLLIRTVVPQAATGVPGADPINKPDESNLQIVLPTELIVRDSTGRPRQ